MKEIMPSSNGAEPSAATFTKRIQDTSTREGSMVQLKCQVVGNPEPEVTWLYENTRIKPNQDKRMTIRGGMATFTILSAQMEDSGLYACEISNGVGEKMSCKSKVTVSEDRTKKFGGKLPHFNKVIQKVQTIAGNRARFTCIAHGKPKPKITWLHEGAPVFETGNVKFTYDGDNYEMEILKVGDEDTGTYVCMAKNSIGERDCSAKLSLGDTGRQNEMQKPKVPPSFDQVAESLRVEEGDAVSFEFQFKGHPAPKVMWKYNGKPILRADRLSLSQPENGTARLAVKSARPSDAGEYTCIVYNAVGEATSTARLTLVGASAPCEKDPDMGIAEKTSVGQEQAMPNNSTGGNRGMKDTAKKSAKPEQAVPNNTKDVMKDAAKMGAKKREAVSTVPKNTSKDPAKEDAKKGEAVSTVPKNTSKDPAKKDAKKDAVPSNKNNLKNTSKDPKKGPPSKPPLVPKIDKKSRTLSWDVKGLDASVRYIIEVRKKGEKTKEWKQIAANLKEPKYSIGHLDPKADYVFRVRAESDSGISEPSEELDMSASKDDREEAMSQDEDSKEMEEGEGGAEEETAPAFLDTTEEVYALDNEDTTLEVFFTGHPAPKITWMQEDEVLASDDHFVISVNHKEGKATLLVKGVTYDDIGEYECIAVNDKGYADCRLYLDVAEPPKFVEVFKNQEITFGNSLKLECRLDGIPEPHVVWYKDDMPLKQSGRVKYLFEGEDGAALQLENFARTDCGEYSIRAYNIAGNIEHCVIVTAPGVEVEPIIRFKIKKDVTIQEEYEILEELGRGAYGIVHRAKCKKTGVERAAKFITIKAGMWDEVRNEIKIMGMLSHKRLIGLYDAYETSRQVNMAMECVTGGELFERIVSQDSITESEAVFFLKQVIAGVSHMHERNVVHLDLKPENILLESNDSDNIKVIDFGLARVLKPDEEIQCACGTPEFVAPEVVRREPIKPASDVWSIGVIAYILLSGCSPFMGEDDRQTLMNVRDGDWEFEEDIWDDISEEAKDFISKVLVVDVVERYTLKQCLDHPWLKFDERRDRGEAKLSTERLKNFNSRRKWRKALNAVKSMMRLRRLSSMIRKEEEEERQEQAAAAAEQGTNGEPQSPNLEPLIEDESEAMDERVPPAAPAAAASKDLNHNEVMKVGEVIQNDKMSYDPEDENHKISRGLEDGNRISNSPEENQKVSQDSKENVRTSVGGRAREGLMERRVKMADQQEAPVNGDDGSEAYADGTPVFTDPLEDAYLFEEGTLLLSCEFRGHPQPKITWYRSGQVINRRANHIQCWREGGRRACLRIVCISIEEGGEICCVAENSNGVAETRCRVDIAEEPDVPTRPKVSLVSSKEAFLTWKTEHQPGKPDITGYSLLFKEYGEENWQTYQSEVRDPCIHVTNLKPNTEYRFRVSSITQYGKGQLSKPSILVKTHPDGTPPLSADMIKTHRVSHTRTINYNRSLSYDSIVSDIDEEEDDDLVIHDLTLKNDVSPTKYYDFLAEIDRGRFAIVRKCRKKANSKEYAAKILKISEKDRNGCFEEHHLLSELKHTNIVQLRDAFQTATHVILIMARYFAGDVLKHLTRTDFFTEESVAGYCLQILDALQYLRLNNILYLDLRHDNLLIESRRRDRLRLVDFGSARKLENNKRIVIPRQDVILEFMSPEVVEGSPVDFGSDIWGLGVLLFTWMSGTAPFLGKSESKTLFNITRPRCNMEQIQDVVSKEARDFLKKIFVRDPSQRMKVPECFDHPWLHCSPEMIDRRSGAKLISRRLRKYRNEYRARVVSMQTTQNVFL